MGDTRKRLQDILQNVDPYRFQRSLVDAAQRSISRIWRPFTSKRRFNRMVGRLQRLESEARMNAAIDPPEHPEPKKQLSRSKQQRSKKRQS